MAEQKTAAAGLRARWLPPILLLCVVGLLGLEPMGEHVVKSEEEWRKVLTPEQFRILRRKGTEPAFAGEYWNSKENGIYFCAGCGTALFRSDTKFESGTGWPSFWDPISLERIRTEPDRSLFMRRTEVLCATCDGHLGHLFEDGPEPTGLRYCINSGALSFKPKERER